jgi:metal-responsive CopG/Arc/MetJ family transcriptional regulator
MVYSGVMVRTQVYLSQDELDLLDRTERETGASRSELIRRAVRAAFGHEDGHDQRLEALGRGVGIWRKRQTTGADYVDGIRGDLNERLTRLGLE